MQIVLHWTFAIGCIWSFVMICFPVVCEKLVIRSSAFAGSDFDVIVKSRRKYRRMVRITGAVLLFVLIPVWLVFAVLLGFFQAMTG